MSQFKVNDDFSFKIVSKDECSSCKNQKECHYKDTAIYFNRRLHSLKNPVILQYFVATWPSILQIDIHCGILQALRIEYKEAWIYYAFDCEVCAKKREGVCKWQDKVTEWRDRKEEIYSTMESFSACFLTGSYDVAIQCYEFESPNLIRETILSELKIYKEIKR